MEVRTRPDKTLKKKSLSHKGKPDGSIKRKSPSDNGTLTPSKGLFCTSNQVLKKDKKSKNIQVSEETCHSTLKAKYANEIQDLPRNLYFCPFSPEIYTALSDSEASLVT